MLGTVQTCQAFAPLLKQNGGAVVNVASQAALVSLPQQAAYSTAKGRCCSVHPLRGHRLGPRWSPR